MQPAHNPYDGIDSNILFVFQSLVWFIAIVDVIIFITIRECAVIGTSIIVTVAIPSCAVTAGWTIRVLRYLDTLNFQAFMERGLFA